MRWRSRDLAAICAVTIAATALLVGGSPSPALRRLLALPVVLFCPGYALAAALSPTTSLGMVQRGLLSLGLSVALAALGGLVLHPWPAGLQSATWVILLDLIILGGSFAAWRRREGSARPQGRWRLSLSVSQGLGFGLAALALVGAIAMGVAGATRARGAAPTQLWLAPGEAAGARTVRVGLRSGEPQATRYRLGLEIDRHAVYTGEPITLGPQESATWRIELPEPSEGLERVEIRLYRLDPEETEYRRLTYWRGR